MHRPGDRVSVKTESEVFEGVLMPNEETDSLILKLDTGYNIGIRRERIKRIVLKQPLKPLKAHGMKRPKQTQLPTVYVLHTGGTIASKVDYRTGGVVSRYSPEELIAMFPELDSLANIESRLISNMASDDMRFSDYALISSEVARAVDKGAHGIVITHGTDTLGYTAAALAFMLHKLPVPVILVGAQRSSDRGSSDAGINLICAVRFIVSTDFAGVAVCMHEGMDDTACLILPATKTRKLHSSRRDAFRPVNDAAIARVENEIKFLREYTRRKDTTLVLRPKMEQKVAILKIHPNMSARQFSSYKGYRGLVLEGTGLGHAPVGTAAHKGILRAIQGLVRSGCIVVMTSQAVFGRVQMHVYANGIDLAAAGVISGEDMLTETAFVKLAWLLANHPKDVKELMGKNLRGEINPRLAPSMFL